MFFRQVLYRDLGCASYVLGDSGEAVVVDPSLDIDVYREIAREEGSAITHVIDTHDHADHLSGRARLAAVSGALAHRPARPADVRADDLQPGGELRAGRMRLSAIATPGHRPEHLALAVSDESRSREPWLVLTGDSLLVGDLARPDLAVTPELGARDLHSTVRRLCNLGDHVEVWPAHIGGSLCGGASLSHKTSSTIGYERRNNPLLSLAEHAFVERLTGSIPSRPPNVPSIVEANRRCSARVPERPALLGPAELLELLDPDVTVFDAREPHAFDEAHVAGAINLPASASSLGTRAGWAVRPDESVVIVAEDERQAQTLTRALQAVGLWRILGIAVRWDGLPIVGERSWDLQTLAVGLKDHSATLVDVREQSEWQAGHVAGSIHLPLGRLGSGRALQPPAQPGTIAVACAAGVRAAFAASLLRRAGWNDVVRVRGGGVGDLPSHGIALSGGSR